MRRLSIIDLEGGTQPIANEDESIWIVFNGEIYNYREVREELAARGHHFRTKSDTEVLVHLYEEHGMEGLSRVAGMFAFCIWDSRQQRVILARDRFGKKPLYYSVRPEGLFFGSEMPCLTATGHPMTMDEDAIRLYFQFTYIPEPMSVYGEVRKVPPGSWLSYDRNGRTEQGRYWSPPRPVLEATGLRTEAEAIESVRNHFDKAVRRRLIADVPVGALLSGGLDSGSVVASMARQTSAPIKTFSVGFKEQGFSELRLARQLAEMYGTDHHEIVVEPNAVELIPRIVGHLGEPFGDSSSIPTWIVSEFAARHVKVVLSGDGGDEIFAGYRSIQAVRSQQWLDRIPATMRRAGNWVSEQLPYSALGKNYLHLLSRPNATDRYFESCTTPYFVRQKLLAPEWMLPADSGHLFRMLPDCLLPPGTDGLRQATYFELTAGLTGDMLTKVDRMSMAQSLEVRCPMLDHNLAETAVAIPLNWKLGSGVGKIVLRRAIGDRLPADFLTAPKKGFSIPLAAWFRGPLREMLNDYLLSEKFESRGFVRMPFLRSLLKEHQRGRRDHRVIFWLLLVLELWLRNDEGQ